MLNRAAILILALALAGCTSQDQTTEVKRAAVPVLEITPQIKDIPIYIESIGTLHPCLLYTSPSPRD